MTNVEISWKDLQNPVEQEFNEAEDIRVKRAKIKLQKEKPFFADLLFFMKIKQERRVPTMGVDIGGSLYYNPEYSKKLSDEEMKGVLIHEVLHLALLHVARGRNKRLTKGKLPLHQLWNLAIDCHANYLVVENGCQLPKEIACVPYGSQVRIMAENNKVVYTVEDVNKKTSEDIYIELYNNLPEEYKGGIKDGFDIHFFDGSDEECEQSEREWKQISLNAMYRSKSIGKMPAGMDRLIDGLVEPKIPWTSELYKFITDDVVNDYTFVKPHKKSESVGFYVPSFTKENLNVALFVDTSGSIADEDVKDFKSEAVAVLNAFESVKMIFGYCDAKVHNVYDLQNGEDDTLIYSKPQGGGGTDMREIFKWLMDNERDADVVIVLTDGYTPFPNAEEVEGSKVLWVITENGIAENDFPKAEGIGRFIKMWKTGA